MPYALSWANSQQARSQASASSMPWEMYYTGVDIQANDLSITQTVVVFADGPGYNNITY